MASRRTRALAENAARRHHVLQRSLLTEEAVLAEGRANWLRQGRVPSGGSTHTYLWVTNRRLIWSTIWGIGGVCSLPLETLRSYEELTFDTHRYVVSLRHTPVTRIEWAPKRTFLWWRWGNSRAPVVRAETHFAFSREGTGAARALWSELDRRGIPGTRLPSPERSPPEPGRFLRRRRFVWPFRRRDGRD